jgi:Flp pilus assembly secretin CpaC
MTRALCLVSILSGSLILSGLLVSAAAADTLTVPIDHSTRLSVRGAAASVVVGNPQVADVTVVDSHTVFVSGRGYGETDVIVLDAAGRTLYAGEVMVAAVSGGQVSVYRGAARTDMACAPNCEVSFRSPTKGTSSGSAGGATAASTGGAAPGGGLAGIVGGALGSAASGVGHAVSGPAGQ